MRTSLCLLALTVLSAVGTSHAAPIYFNGFENGTGDWAPDTTYGSGNGAITQTPSGVGGITAFDGSYYGTVTADINGYLPQGSADGGFSFFGSGGNPIAYPGSPFAEQMAVYIDVNTPPPSSASSSAFWVDMAPGSNRPE